MADVLEINRIEELDPHRAVWQSLLEQTPRASIFQSHRWLCAYWRRFGAGQKLRTLIVSRNGTPIGILPLVVRNEPTRVGRIRVLTYPLHDWGSFYGPIGPEPRATLSAGLEYVHRAPRDWELLELRWVDGSSGDPLETQRAMQSAGFQGLESIWERTAQVDVSGTWEAYLASRPKKWRANFRRWERKLADWGEITHVRYRPRGESHGEADPRWDLYDACESIARQSWQSKSKTGTTLSHDSVRSFLREVHAAAAKEGSLDLNLLRIAGQPAAFAYNYASHGYVYGLRMGYVHDRFRDGAGSLLVAYALRDSFLSDDHTYDLGVGYLESKRYLLTRIAPILRFSHYASASPKAQLLRMKRWAQCHLGLPHQSAFASLGPVDACPVDG